MIFLYLNKLIPKEEKIIFEAASEFREQERLNSSCKHQLRGIPVDESNYESSEENDRFEYDKERRSNSDDPQSDVDLDAQSRLIEDFFALDEQETNENLPLEINEELSESSEDSVKNKRTVIKVYQDKENTNPLNKSKPISEVNSGFHVSPDNVKIKGFNNSGLKSKRKEDILKSVLSDGIKSMTQDSRHSSQVHSQLEAANTLIGDRSK